MAGISGTATFEQRKNNETLVTIALEGTPAEGVHPAHIHANTAAEGGEIVIPLADVNGATGMSMTNIGAFVLGEDTDSLTYSRLIDYDGYINVHQSETQLDVIVAQGDIGQERPDRRVGDLCAGFGCQFTCQRNRYFLTKKQWQYPGGDYVGRHY